MRVQALFIDSGGLTDYEHRKASHTLVCAIYVKFVVIPKGLIFGFASKVNATSRSSESTRTHLSSKAQAKTLDR